MNLLRGLPGRPAHQWFEREFQYQLEMVRPAAPAHIFKLPSIPPGYALRQFRVSDEKPYDDLFHLAFEDEGRFGEILERALNEGFFVVEHIASGELVSSCVAMRGSSSPRHREAGQLGWLITDPSHCAKGLGTIVATAVTNRLAAEGYLQPFLGTEDFRIAAISIYLRLGWRPYIYRAEMEERWRNILSRVGDRMSETCFVY